jgi:hypothetical protein
MKKNHYLIFKIKKMINYINLQSNDQINSSILEFYIIN